MFPYIGGKSHHIKHLDKIFYPITEIFVDVFGGAGWVSVKTKQPAAQRIYNDYNQFLAMIFDFMSSDPEGLACELEQYPPHNRELYRQFQQEIFNNQADYSIETAAKYLYLQTQNFSGNTLGLNSSIYFHKLKTPQSVIKKLRNPKIKKRLQHLTVENLDCLEVIEKYDSDRSFFYIDPPYYCLEHYYTKQFDRQQHFQLAKKLHSIKGRFALSYYEFPQLKTWFPENQYRYTRYSVSKQSSSSKNKTHGIELVITNY